MREVVGAGRENTKLKVGDRVGRKGFERERPVPCAGLRPGDRTRETRYVQAERRANYTEGTGQADTYADFDRNRDGLYGGLPKARDKSALGPKANEAHPPKKEDVRH